ncbi:ribonuclease HI [Gracilinema caldarium]|uniref:Ribonuclease H n=1 Tax=Gracilinema caldarium (strain ATCC 51460 / DSM 7334 / H1) TaxID=744872 RepID=F8EYL9_GRAC1|nr:ribonuclease HI [Gracilinema caldarium]AEJ18596.1 Ribonuclease H [Gracilinema caldarium DSM 7334]
MNDTQLMVFTDGGCSGNPGPGGWAYLIVCESRGIIDEKWGAEQLTTNNRMELSAAVEALEAVLVDPSLRTVAITLYTDSQYVQKGITSWIHGWKRNGWKTSNKEPVKNQDLWQKLDQLANTLQVEWRWVKGHAGHEYNERVDRLTQEAIASLCNRIDRPC